MDINLIKNNMNSLNEWDILLDTINDKNDIDINQINNSDVIYINASNSYTNLNLMPDFSKNLKIDFKKCPKCNIECKIETNMMYCVKCGYENDMNIDNNKFSISYTSTHNTSDNSFVSFKIVGKGSYSYHKSLLKTCADYTKYSYNNIIRELQNLVYQHKGNKIPKNIIIFAANMYNDIRSYGRVFRGDSKKGIMVACIYYACRINKITKTPRYLCNLTKTPDKYLSQGERILQDFIERNMLQIPILDDPKLDYISQYFEALKINTKYKTFVIDLIYRAEKKSLHIIKDSRDTTKCAGSIYMLCTRVPELKKISKENIELNCEVSRTTFIRYYNLLYDNYKKIKKTFIKHKIPMPNEWRN